MIDLLAVTTVTFVGTTGLAGIVAANLAHDLRTKAMHIRAYIADAKELHRVLNRKQDRLEDLASKLLAANTRLATFDAAEAKRIAQREDARKKALAAVQRRKAERLARLAKEGKRLRAVA